MKVIAKIKLSGGNVGWYDPLSNIHLTISNPIGEITAGMKLEGIRNSLKYGSVILLEGSLDESEIVAQDLAEQAVKQVKQEKALVSAEVTPETADEADAATQTETDEKPKKSSKKKS